MSYSNTYGRSGKKSKNFKNPSILGESLKNYNENNVLITKRRGGTDTGDNAAVDGETVKGNFQNDHRSPRNGIFRLYILL